MVWFGHNMIHNKYVNDLICKTLRVVLWGCMKLCGCIVQLLGMRSIQMWQWPDAGTDGHVRAPTHAMKVWSHKTDHTRISTVINLSSPFLSSQGDSSMVHFINKIVYGLSAPVMSNWSDIVMPLHNLSLLQLGDQLFMIYWTLLYY